MRCLPVSLAAALLLAAGPAAGDGILVYKEQEYHLDDRAPAIRASWLKGDDKVTWFQTADGRRGFEPHEFYRYIELPGPLPPLLVEPESRQQLETTRDQLVAFGNRFHRARPLMADDLEALEEAMRRFDAGEVIFGGRWMTRQDYEAMSEEELRRAEERRLAAQKRAREELERQELERQLAEARQREAEAADLQARVDRVRLLTTMIESLEQEIAALDQRDREIAREMLLSLDGEEDEP